MRFSLLLAIVLACTSANALARRAFTFAQERKANALLTHFAFKAIVEPAVVARNLHPVLTSECDDEFDGVKHGKTDKVPQGGPFTPKLGDESDGEKHTPSVTATAKHPVVGEVPPSPPKKGAKYPPKGVVQPPCPLTPPQGDAPPPPSPPHKGGKPSSPPHKGGCSPPPPPHHNGSGDKHPAGGEKQPPPPAKKSYLGAFQSSSLNTIRYKSNVGAQPGWVQFQDFKSTNPWWQAQSGKSTPIEAHPDVASSTWQPSDVKGTNAHKHPDVASSSTDVYEHLLSTDWFGASRDHEQIPGYSEPF